MKLTSLFSLFLLAALMFACGPEGEKVESSEALAEAETTTAAAAYTVDPAMSIINWEGTKLVGGGHEGTINISSGRIALANNNIVGGDFTVDMTSLANTDLEAGNGKEKLEGHLKSGDFFNVEEYPTATFNVVSAQPVPAGNEGPATHQVTGNFTMKGQTRSIAIPVIVSMDGDMLKIASNDFVIDRTEWGVNYGADGSVADLAKDNIINDNVGLVLQIVAKK
ncbi:hypothetical protein CEQ90_03325 [Lewinellaceae bacterium SD302]|nr:hypothetical protein CEQ90_03325 [Lewinellaceae bacterium SD302]